MAIKLPMDANGRVIPLDTTMMYRNDNSQFHVTDFFYEARPDKWFARSGSECIETNKLYLESKKKVAEYRAEDVLVNRPKKTNPAERSTGQQGRDPIHTPRVCNAQRMGRGFQCEREDRLQDVQPWGANDREGSRQHPHLPRPILCTAWAR